MYHWTYRSGDIAPRILTSTLDRAQWSVSRPGRFTHGERTGTHCTGGWVGPTAGLNATARRRNPLPRIEPP
jgi:hypothetical protein